MRALRLQMGELRPHPRPPNPCFYSPQPLQTINNKTNQKPGPCVSVSLVSIQVRGCCLVLVTTPPTDPQLFKREPFCYVFVCGCMSVNIKKV